MERLNEPTLPALKMKTKLFLWIGATLIAGTLLAAEPAITLTIHADQPGAKINPAMWGIFFEDINFGADGGLYAELVKNRGFEFPDPVMGWSKAGHGAASGSWSVLTDNPFNAANPHYLRIYSDGEGAYGVANEGFRGIGVHEGEAYNFSAQIRGAGGSPALVVELVDADGRILASERLENLSPNWSQRKATLHPIATAAKAHLNVLVEGKGSVDLDMVSLFPQHTWKNRPGGLRADAAQLLADLKPGFLRFPGGCIVEGRDLTNRYQWKNTIGPIEERKVMLNRWNVEFASRGRGAPDYYQSFGLGFFEFFQLCEDIGASPLPILNCGMACQFNSGQLCPVDQLNSYIQDDLDLIEFANGPASSTWGAKRAAMGHPRPFNLKLLGVGNEQWGPQYIERYEKFTKALKAKYPNVQLVSAAGPDPSGDKFDFLWPKLRELKADLVDEHFYRPPSWFLDNTHRYDNYDRNGPKVFAGEYAAQSVETVSAGNRNNLECALAEAAMMIGFERNADVVRMASYAPLSANVEAWQWRPNLIWFDNLRIFGTPNYYAQQLFSCNRGDVVLPVAVTGVPLAGNGQPRFYVSAIRDVKTGEIIIKAVNATAAPVEANLQLKGVSKLGSKSTVTILTSASLTDENSLDEPRKVAPVTVPFSAAGTEFGHVFKPNSITVLRLSAAR
jgi:alpha-L-arabinofuranosidase